MNTYVRALQGHVALAAASILVLAASGAAVAGEANGAADTYAASAAEGTLDALAEQATTDLVLDGRLVEDLYDVDAFLVNSDADGADLASLGEEVGATSALEQSDLYGAAIAREHLEALAPLLVSQEIADPSIDASDVVVGAPQGVLDPFEVLVGYAWNFSAGTSRGYIVLSAHTRAPLLLDFALGSVVPQADRTFFLSDGEFYLERDGSFLGVDGQTFDSEEVRQAIVDRRLAYLSIDLDLLLSLEQSTKAQLNNLTFVTQQEFVETELGKTYDGQDSHSGGGTYGRISNPKTYMADRYGAKEIKLYDSRILSVSTFDMDTYGPKNDCVPIAITRVFHYLRSMKGFDKVPKNRSKLYDKVLAKAKKWGFTPSSGTNPVNIDNIMSELAKDFGYKSTVKDIYGWTFAGTVKPEVDNGRPLLMNIARGSYAGHTVTVNGYKRYDYKYKIGPLTLSKRRIFIAVIDSWKEAQRYIDWDAFAYDLVHAGFGSFNTMELKK